MSGARYDRAALNPFRRKNLAPKLLPLYALAGLGLWLADPHPLGVALGALLVISGLALRAWAAGHLVKTRVLAVSGPYAHLRHPLYAGAFLAVAGFGLAVGPLGVALVLGVAAPLFFAYYLPRKERIETERLRALHGESYERYRAEVPALLPRVWRSPPSVPADRSPVDRSNAGGLRWSAARFLANDEHGTVAGVALAALLLLMRGLS